jgi:hypothetical protein
MMLLAPSSSTDGQHDSRAGESHENGRKYERYKGKWLTSQEVRDGEGGSQLVGDDEPSEDDNRDQVSKERSETPRISSR